MGDTALWGFRLGQTVRIVGDHPWSGQRGWVDRFEWFAGQPALVVRIEANGTEHHVGVVSRTRLRADHA